MLPSPRGSGTRGERLGAARGERLGAARGERLGAARGGRPARARGLTAFTLVELLVTIAILAALAAILLPVFNGVRERARTTTCLSNGKQIGLAMLMYAQDYDDYWVPVGGENRNTVLDGVKSDGTPFNGWSLLLLPYTKNRDVFRCPSLPDTFEAVGYCAGKGYDGKPITNCYSYNYFLGSDDSYPFEDYYQSDEGGVRWNTPRSEDEIELPANVVALQHSSSLQPFGRDWGCVYVTIETPDFANVLRMRVVHQGGDNLTFADGHSRWFHVEDADSADLKDDKETRLYTVTARGIWMVPQYNPGKRGSDKGYAKKNKVKGKPRGP